MMLPYVYRWNNQGRKGQSCAWLVRGTMNSCLLRFADGFTMVTTRNALAKNKAFIGPLLPPLGSKARP